MKTMKKQELLIATGQEAINKALKSFEDYEYVGEVEDKDVLEEVALSLNPDILVVGDALGGSSDLSIPSLILSIYQKNKDIRIIYLTTTKLTEEAKVGSLALLVTSGIYDVIYNRRLNYEVMKEILDNPKKKEDTDIQRIISTSNRITKKSKTEVDFYIPEEVQRKELDDGSYKNVSVISSIKPGTGKSFVSTNVATAIAEYGENTEEGKRPKVALIEADLQNLSIGTLLQIEDNRRNIKTAMESIAKIITPEGGLIEDIDLIEETDATVKSSFLPYRDLANLRALVGSQLSYEDVVGIKGIHFAYLIDSIVDYFDVIVIDSNSSLSHSTTSTLLQKASSCFYVINLDFNNVRNNVRYKDTLKDIGIDHKVKYVLNEDVTNPLGDEIEELEFGVEHLVETGFDFVAKIPLIPKTVFLNRLFAGTPIVLDELEYTHEAKYELLKVANEIYPIKGFEDMDKEVVKKRRLFGLL